MKKLLIAICLIVSVNSFSQIDTIYVRNLTLRAEDWYWLKGNWNPGDSLQKVAWKKIRTTLVTAAPATNITNVTIDSIPGRIALFFYATFLNHSKGETSNLTNNISQNIKGYTPMLTFTSIVDAEFTSRFQNGRKNGKDDFDN